MSYWRDYRQETPEPKDIEELESLRDELEYELEDLEIWRQDLQEAQLKGNKNDIVYCKENIKEYEVSVKDIKRSIQRILDKYNNERNKFINDLRRRNQKYNEMETDDLRIIWGERNKRGISEKSQNVIRAILRYRSGFSNIDPKDLYK